MTGRNGEKPRKPVPTLLYLNMTKDRLHEGNRGTEPSSSMPLDWCRGTRKIKDHGMLRSAIHNPVGQGLAGVPGYLFETVF